MSMNEILEELDHLSPNELKLIQEKLEMLQTEFEMTPELSATIDEGIRSAQEGPMLPIEEVIKEIETWNTKSP